MIRVVLGGIAFAAGFVLALFGALLAVLKTIGTEWDYCRTGGECISGYYPAAGLVLAGGAIAAVGLVLVRAGRTPNRAHRGSSI